MSYEAILYEVNEGVATITFNRPNKMNAFNGPLTTETIHALKQASRDKTVRAIIVTGSGRGFSAGQDLDDMSDRGDDFSIATHLRTGFNRIITQLTTIEKPVVGAINGIAAGAGCGIALACDIRIMSDKASFMQAFSRVGLIPDSGSTWFLPRIVGYARAYEMAITADKIKADKALEWGMANDVVPHEQLMEVANAWAQKLASGPTFAFGLTKRAMNRAMTSTLSEALEYEALLQDVAGGSEDNIEGVTAFLEKRAPQFKGR